MCRIFNILVLIFFMATTSSTATASPKLLYQFQSINIECYAASETEGICPEGGGGYAATLNEMYLVFHPNALRNGYAKIYYDTLTDGSGYYFENDGNIFDFGVGVYSPERSIPLDPDYYDTLANPGPNVLIVADLSLGSYLNGSIILLDGSSEMVLHTGRLSSVWFLSEGSVPSRIFLQTNFSNEWGGVIRSDGLADRILGFTGVWRFSRVVPEPGTIPLMVVGLAAIALFIRRQRLPQPKE
jgi:hypothetical protein